MNIQARARPIGEYKALKDASRKVIEENGGLPSSADRTRIAESQLQRCASNHHDAFLTIDVAYDLEAACGEPVITARLAQLHGYALVPIETAKFSRSEWLLHIGKVSREAGTLISLITDALTDGKIDQQEAEHLLEEVYAIQKHLADLTAALKEIVRGDQ